MVKSAITVSNLKPPEVVRLSYGMDWKRVAKQPRNLDSMRLKFSRWVPNKLTQTN